MPQVAPLEVHRNFLFQPNGSSEETGRTEDEAKIELQGPNEEYYSSDEAGDKDNATWIELQEDNIVGLCSQEIVEHMQEARICGKRDAAHHTLRNSRHASGSDTETMRRKHHAEKAAPAQFCLLRRYSWHASVHETEAMRSTCNAAEDAQAQRALLNRFSWPCEEPTLRRSMSSAEDETTKVMNLVHRPYQVIQYCSEASQAKVKMPRIKIPSIPPESELSRTSKVEPEMPQHRDEGACVTKEPRRMDKGITSAMASSPSNGIVCGKGIEDKSRSCNRSMYTPSLLNAAIRGGQASSNSPRSASPSVSS